MPNLSPEVVDLFARLFSWAHESWITHRTLFDDNPDAESINSGPSGPFLRRLSVITQEYCLQQLAKLHDPSSQGKKTNLSIGYVLERGGWEKKTFDTLSGLKMRLDALADIIAPARNKVLAHNDLQTQLDNRDLGAFPKGADLEYFRVLLEFVGVVYFEMDGRTVEFVDVAQTEARSFVANLPRGIS